jgi:hypothetical protein
MIHIKKRLTGACKTIICLDSKGNPVFKEKKKFDTQDEAIEICKIENAKPNRFHKVVPYRCNHCGKYHIGKNGNLIKRK